MKFPPVLPTLAAAILCGFGFSAAADPAAPKQVTVVFRYDDFSARSDDTTFEVNLLHEFTRHNIPCTYAVIPFVCTGDAHDSSPQQVLPLTAERFCILKDAVEAGQIEVAQHGYNHQTQSGRGPGLWTEFGGRPLADQVARIRKGKELLAGLLGRDPDTFVPPWNSYDSATIQAAQLCGFSSFSGNGQGPSQPTPIRLVPATTEPRELKQVCLSALASRDREPLVIVLFHEYDFLEIDPARGYMTLAQFSELLDWIASRPDIRPTTIREVAAADDSRYIAFQSLQTARRLVPSSLLRVLALDWPAGTYPSLDTIIHFRRSFRAMVAPLYLGLFGVAATGGHWMRARSGGRQERYVFPTLFLGLSGVVLALSLTPEPLTAKHLCLLVALSGLSLGSWSELLRSLKLVKP